MLRSIFCFTVPFNQYSESAERYQTLAACGIHSSDALNNLGRRLFSAKPVVKFFQRRMQKLRDTWFTRILHCSCGFQPRLTSLDVDRFPRVEAQRLRAGYHALVDQIVNKVLVLLGRHLVHVALSR